MSGRLEGRVAFITGVARGQGGRAHAVRMAKEGGADIIAVDIAGKLPRCVPYDPATPEDLDETVKLVEETGRRILASVVDTRDSEAMNAAVETGVSELGRLDIIVANAGVSAPQAWDDISPDDFRDVMDINVTGTWNTVMAGAQKIIDGGRGGSVILISSAAGIKLQPFMIHYTASKHAVTGMARAFAAELGKHSIRVNSVHPGPVITDMGTGDMVTALGKAMETNPQLSHMMTPFLPTWAVEPEDIADTVSWLACDDSKYITASAISIDQAQPTTERAASFQERHLILGRLVEPIVARPHVEVITRVVVHLALPCLAVAATASAGTYWSKSAIWTSSGQRNLLAAAVVRTPATSRPTDESISLRHVGPANDR